MDHTICDVPKFTPNAVPVDKVTCQHLVLQNMLHNCALAGVEGT
jgi:hypothetical protein